MKEPIMVHVEPFDIIQYREKINSIVQGYVHFLEQYSSKTMRSKHGVMGPVAKILERAKTRTVDPVALTSMAWRNLEMNSQHRGGLNSSDVMDVLEKATRELVELCNEIPISVIDRMVDLIDANIYYERRKANIIFLENIRIDFINFLKSKYPTINEVVEAWKDKRILSFDDIPYPSKRNEAYTKNKGTRKKDIDDFWSSKKDVQIEEEEEE